ncbi:MAG: translocation/assembly module TamB domain-containing protein, partial [Candidatus Binataceae bacterium]
MAVALRYLTRVFAALLILLLLIVAGVAIYLRTGAFNQVLRQKAIAYLAANYRGRITFQRIDASVLRRITITNLTVAYQGQQATRIPFIRIHYSLIPLLWYSLHVRLAAFAPVINLQRQNGEWNLLEAISPRTVSKTHSTLAVRLNVQVHNGVIEVAPQGAGGSRYHLDNLAFDLSAALTPAGTSVSLKHLFTRIEAPGFPQAELMAALAYNSDPGRVSVSRLALKTRNSALALNGTLSDFKQMKVDAVLTISKLAASDIAAVTPVRLQTGLSGRIVLAGPKNALHAEVTLKAGVACLKARILADLAARVPTYDAKIQLASIDLRQLLGGGNPAGVIAGTITAHGSGLALGALAGQAQLTDRGASVASLRLGDIALKLSAKNGAAQFRGLITNGPSRVNFDGQSELAADGRYRLTLAASQLDLRRILANNPQPTDLNFTLGLDGQGFQLAQMTNAARLRLSRSKVAGLQIDRGALDARIANQRATIVRSMVVGAGWLIEAHGLTGLSTTAPLRLAYHLQASNIAPWLKLKHLSGGGKLAMTGTAAGRLNDLSAQGEIKGENLRHGSDSVAHAHLTYHLTALGHGLPHGRVVARLDGINAPVKLKRLDAAIELARGNPVRFHLAFDTLDRSGRTSELAARFRYRPGAVEGQLERAALALPDGVWRLSAPAGFSENTRGLAFDHLRFRNGPREVALNGNLAWQGAQHLTLTMRGLELADFASIIKREAAGELAGQVEVKGTAAAPLVSARLELVRLRMSGQSIGALDLRARYAARQAALNAVFTQDPNHRLSAVGSIPARLQWAHGFSAQIGKAMDMKLHSTGLKLGPLAALAPGRLKDTAGLLAVDLVLHGPVERPVTNGTLRVNGHTYIIPLGVNVTDVSASVRATPTQILAQVSATSGDGTLRGNGTVAMSDYAPGQINAQLNFHHWPAIGTRQYKAWIDGQIVADGTTDAPRLGGQIDVKHSVIRPDLAFLSATSDLTPDPTIEVIEPGQTAATAAPHPKPAPSGFNRMAMDVLVRISRHTWIKHEHAQVEL